jgi:hypothetical protein
VLGGKKSILNITFSRGFFESLDDRRKNKKNILSVDSFVDRLSSIETKNSGLESKKHLINFSDSAKEVIENYMANPPVIKNSHSKNHLPCKMIDSAVETYDKFMNKVRLCHRKVNSYN